MADIDMCKNKECPLSHFCWRFNAPPNPDGQYYSNFESHYDKKLDETKCDFFIDMEDMQQPL